MTLLDRIVIAIGFGFLVMMIFGNNAPQQARRPLPAPQARGEPAQPATPAPAPAPERVRRPLPLPPPAPTDPVFGVDVGVLKSGSFTLGTAFPVNPRGVWLTARHVASEHCEQLTLVVEGRGMPATVAFLHAESDLAIVTTGQGASAVLLSDGVLTIGDTGLSFGFPTGLLGATEDTLMGRMRMQLGGRLSGTAATLAWAEGRRFPDTLERLGGMSGGPMFDQDGRVIGIVVAASERRGRVMTVAPEMLAEAGRTTGLFALGIAETGLGEIAGTDNGLAGAAAALAHASRIAKLYCKVR